MKARVEAGTDIASVGAWDAALQQDVLADRSDQAAVVDAAQARLFLIRTGGDGGGPVDVYVDEEMPAAARRRVRKVGRKEHLLSVSSGRLMIGGVEDYRSDRPGITDADSVIAIPPGDYAIACLCAREELEDTGFDPPTAEQLQAALGESEYRYYRRMEKIALRGYLNLLWFPVLWPVIGWKWALGVMLVAVTAYMNVHERLLQRNARYQAAKQRENELCSRAMQSENPTLVLTLRRVSERGELTGGAVCLESAKAE